MIVATVRNVVPDKRYAVSFYSATESYTVQKQATKGRIGWESIHWCYNIIMNNLSWN